MPTIIRRICTAVPTALAVGMILSARGTQPVAASSEACIVANQTGPFMFWFTASSPMPGLANALCAKMDGYQGNYIVDTTQSNLPPGQQACLVTIGAVTLQEYYLADTDSGIQLVTDNNRFSYNNARSVCDEYEKLGLKPFINSTVNYDA